MKQRLSLLRKALSLLAQPGQEQLDHLRNLGIQGNIDELALEYDDIAAAADDMLQQGELNKSQYDLVVILSNHLRHMSVGKDQSLWSDMGLMNRPEWQDVRERAKACLAAL